MECGTKKRWVLSACAIMGALFLCFVGGKLGLPAGAETQLRSGQEGRIIVVPVQIKRDSCDGPTPEQVKMLLESSGQPPKGSKI